MTSIRAITSLLCLLVAIEGHNYNYPRVIDGGTVWHHTGLLVTGAGTRPIPTSQLNLPHPLAYGTPGSNLLPLSPLSSLSQTTNIVGSNPLILPGSPGNLPGSLTPSILPGSLLPGPNTVGTLNTLTGSTVLGPSLGPASLGLVPNAGPGYASNAIGSLTSLGSSTINTVPGSPVLGPSLGPASLGLVPNAGAGYASNAAGSLTSLGSSTINTVPGSPFLGPSLGPASLGLVPNAGAGYASNAAGSFTSLGSSTINTVPGSPFLGPSLGPASLGLVPNAGAGYASNAAGSFTSLGSSTINTVPGSPFLGPSLGPASLGLVPNAGPGYASNAIGPLTSLGSSTINTVPGSPFLGPSLGPAPLGFLPDGPGFASNNVGSLTRGSLTNSAALGIPPGNLLGTTGSSVSRSATSSFINNIAVPPISAVPPGIPNFADQSFLGNTQINPLSISPNLPITSGSINVANQNAISIPPQLTQSALPDYLTASHQQSSALFGASGTGYPTLPSPVSYPPVLPPNLLNGGSISATGATAGLLSSAGGLSLPSIPGSVSSGSLNALSIPLAGSNNQNFQTTSLLNSGINRASLSGSSNLYGPSPYLNYASQYYNSHQYPAGTQSYYSYREGPQYRQQYLNFPLGSASSALQGGSRTTLGSHQLNRPDWIIPYSPVNAKVIDV